MDPKLEDLNQRLKNFEDAENAKKITPEQQRDANNMSVGMRAGAELVGSIMAGGFIGWLIDNWLGSKPWGLIIMLLLGVITGFVNVWRTTQDIGTQVGYSELHNREKPAKTPADKGES